MSAGCLLIIASIVSLIVILFGYAITRPIQRDLGRLERAVTRLESGELSARANVPDHGRDRRRFYPRNLIMGRGKGDHHLAGEEDAAS